ncbi:MAG: hypothetical protein JSS86_14050 [Cyanobacteria bacterium SZAS LIN-2]|nr:hypothetical protein [Cyanobacteria bacterium SZAS LIN-2]
MDRTLFSPAMLEAFKACKRAYQLAYSGAGVASRSASAAAICKRFIMRGLCLVNRGQVATPSQLQKFMGQHWPIDKLSDHPGGRDSATRAFLYAYKTLLNYSATPYRPAGSHIGAVALKVRSRVPNSRVYIEDVFDMVLWYPEEKKLEIVLFHLKPLRGQAVQWPSPSTLVRQHLAERLKVRWPFEKLVLTMIKVGPSEMKESSTTLEESLYRLHWPEIVKCLEEMQDLGEVPAHEGASCAFCRAIEEKMPGRENEARGMQAPISLSA